jgi:arsenite methyltransferase
MNEPTSFFEFAAQVGLTKHIGGVEATNALIELCHIGEGQYILDVGCGVGVTPCYIARKYGCKVAGVDIVEKMIERSRERAKREKLSDRVEFRVADVQELPFEDNVFDAVLSESVTALPDDQLKAVREYVRVLKPGGYVGLNEATWLKVSPPPEIIAWVSQDVGGTAKPLASSEWTALLESAGLSEIIASTSKVNVQTESRGIVQRYGCLGMLGVFRRIFTLYLRNPAYRKFVREVQTGGLIPKNLDEYFGYGLFVGRKT